MIREFLNGRLILHLLVVLASALESLAGLDIRFDYRYDVRGFFSGNNAGRREILEAAAAVIEARVENTPPAINPSGINTWTLSFPNLNSGANTTLRDLRVPAGVMFVFVGARQLSGSLIGYAEYNYTYFGDSQWVALFSGKDDASNFSPFGGSISFDVDTPWYFDATPETDEPFPNQYDFFSLALHELGHLLGITGGARAFDALSQFDEFYGNQSQAVYGGPIPLSPDGNHWRQSVVVAGIAACMTPNFSPGQRKPFSELEFAALTDIGYTIAPRVEPVVLSAITFAGTEVTVTWQGGTPPFQLQAKSDLNAVPWETFGPSTNERTITFEASEIAEYFQVIDSQ